MTPARQPFDPDGPDSAVTDRYTPDPDRVAVPGEPPPAGGVRRAAKARTRLRVRDAARELFLSRGFADTTTQQVAARAEVAVGTLFQHATDKEDLLLLVLHDPLAAAMRSASTRPDSDDVLLDLTVRFAALLKTYAGMERAARPAVRALLFGAGVNARAVQWLHETHLEQVVARIERAQQAGALADGADPRRLAGNLAALYQGVLIDWLLGNDVVDVAVQRLRAALALQIIPLQLLPPETTTPGARRSGARNRA